MAHTLLHAAEKLANMHHWHNYIGPDRIKHRIDAFEAEFRHPQLRRAELMRYFNYADLIYDDVLNSPFYKGRQEVLAALRLPANLARDKASFEVAEAIHLNYQIPERKHSQLNQDDYETEMLVHLFIGRLHQLGDPATLETEKVKRLKFSMEHQDLHEKVKLYFATINIAKTPFERIVKSTHVV